MAARGSVKKSANGNMYEATLFETREMFAPYLSGAAEGVVCVVCIRPLATKAQAALCSSAAALGYGREACIFVTLHENDAKESPVLDPQALFLLVEGLDPLVAVAADKESATALGQAYHHAVALDAPGRLFGRNIVAFNSFEKLLDSAQGKQTAWALLKKLPKFGEQ